MKKLLVTTMAAVSLAFCAKATLTEETFETYGEGSLFGTLPGDSSKYEISDGWETETTLENLFTVTNIANYVGANTYPEKANLPLKSDSVKALAIDTSAPLLRYADSFEVPQSLSEDPIFFDSVVQFTATDVKPIEDGQTGNGTDKLMVWLYQSPENLDEGLFDETESISRVVVTAGRIETENGATSVKVENYLTDISVDPDTWHRLTIKSFINMDSASEFLGHLMFEVRVDGNKVTVAENEITFLSLLPANNDTLNLQGVAFDGKGAVDDIVFTTTDPFAAPEPVVETFALDLSVVADEAAEAQILTVYADGAEMERSEGSYELNVEASNVSAWVYCGEGYEVSNDGATYDEENGYWVVPVDISGAQANGTLNVTITVVPAVTPEVEPFAVTIEGGEKSFASLAEAIAAANGATIALKKDATLTEKLTVENDAVIDLAGKKLTLANVKDNYAVVIKAALTITDSSELKTGTVVLHGLYGFGITAGSLTIDAGTFNASGADYLIGAWGGTVSISGGDFTSGYCVLNLFAAGAKANVSGGKFTVVGEDPEYRSEVILSEAGGTVAVSGGLFSTQLTDALCAKGYTPTTTPVGGYFTVEEKPTVGEEEVEAGDVVNPDKVNSSTEIELPNGWTVDGNEIKDGDTVFATFPSYYTVTVVDGKVTLALNDTVKPVIAESKEGDNMVKPMEFAKDGDKDVVKINVPNRNAKLFYGIKAAASITGLNAATPVWATTRGANPPAAAKTGDAQFFKVVVTDVIK